MARKPEYRAALFDLDDTLVDRRAAYDYVYRLFYDMHEPINSTTSWAEAREFFWTLSPGNATDPPTAIAEIQKRWPDVPGTPESHYHFYFENLVKGLRPLDGVVEFVDDLNASGIPWGVVTNGDRYQLKKVEVLNLQDMIPFVLVSKVFGAAKPEQAIYEEAMRLLDLDGTGPGDVLFAGDNPHTDIIGAHRMGMGTAWVHMGREYPSSAPAPDFTVSNVTELRPLLGLE